MRKINIMWDTTYLNRGLNLGESNTPFCRPGDRETADAPSLWSSTVIPTER